MAELSDLPKLTAQGSCSLDGALPRVTNLPLISLPAYSQPPQLSPVKELLYYFLLSWNIFKWNIFKWMLTGVLFWPPQHVGSSASTRGSTQAPCIGSTKS